MGTAASAGPEGRENLLNQKEDGQKKERGLALVRTFGFKVQFSSESVVCCYLSLVSWDDFCLHCHCEGKLSSEVGHTLQTMNGPSPVPKTASPTTQAPLPLGPPGL